MAYNPIHPKKSTVFPDNEQFQPGHAIDTTLIHRLTNFPFVTKFYGTDSHGERDGYLSTINRAMKDRVVTPINECLGQKRKYFFKPYNSAPQLLYNSIHGYFLTSNAYYASMGMLSNSLFTLSMLCLPAVIELVSGITSLQNSRMAPPKPPIRVCSSTVMMRSAIGSHRDNDSKSSGLTVCT